MKRLAAPKAWMLDKLGGVFAPRPSTGPHKLRESLPLLIFLRNRLKYALTGAEVTKIVMQRLIKVDGKVRTDATYPAGFMGECNYSIILIAFIFHYSSSLVSQIMNCSVYLLCIFATDVITIERTGEFFRLVYDVKGRFTIHRISKEEAQV